MDNVNLNEILLHISSDQPGSRRVDRSWQLSGEKCVGDGTVDGEHCEKVVEVGCSLVVASIGHVDDVAAAAVVELPRQLTRSRSEQGRSSLARCLDHRWTHPEARVLILFSPWCSTWYQNVTLDANASLLMQYVTLDAKQSRLMPNLCVNLDVNDCVLK